MKSMFKIGGLVVAGLCLGAAIVSAQPMQTVTLSVNSLAQNNIIDNGTNTTYTTILVPASTAALLRIIAVDEHAAGTYAASNFPAGARLVVSNGIFSVVNKTNGLIVDVSNILTFTNLSSNVVRSGRQRDSTGRLANPVLVRKQIGRLTFDDTAIAGGLDLQFYLQGVVTETQTDTVNNLAHTFTETRSGVMPSGAGDGTADGSPFMISGTVTATGRGTFPLP